MKKYDKNDLINDIIVALNGQIEKDKLVDITNLFWKDND